MVMVLSVRTKASSLMLEIAVGAGMALIGSIGYLIWSVTSVREDKVRAEEEARRLRIGRKKEAARREILREPTGNGDAWRRRMRSKLRDARRR